MTLHWCLNPPNLVQTHFFDLWTPSVTFGNHQIIFGNLQNIFRTFSEIYPSTLKTKMSQILLILAGIASTGKVEPQIKALHSFVIATQIGKTFSNESTFETKNEWNLQTCSSMCTTVSDRLIVQSLFILFFICCTLGCPA